MIAIKPSQIRDNFKKYCDQVVSGETIIVARPNNENVVVISEDEYNRMKKSDNNLKYFAMIDQSLEELKKGSLVSKTFNELEEIEK